MSEVLIWIILTMTPAGYSPQGVYFTTAKACHDEVKRQYKELEEKSLKGYNDVGVVYNCMTLVPHE